MSRVDVVRAWKNANYRSRLSPAETASLPRNPAGSIEKTGGDVMHRQSASTGAQLTTAWFCTMYSVGGSRCCH
jgi:mersacidin/lichenicidin family type 2 lantibiotic